VNLAGRGEVFVRVRPALGPALATPEPADAVPPDVVLLHGWTASADLNWFRVYDSVAPASRVIAIDHRGHGRGLRSAERFSLEAAADDVAALLETLHAAPAIVAGYSMGGPISLLLTHRHPELVAGLVLEATALEWRATRRERVIWKFMAAVEFVLRSGRPRSLVERALRDAVEQSPDLGPLVPWLQAELRRGDPEAIADAGRALGNYDARPFAGSIRVPTSVVVTTKDRLVRPKKQRQLVAAIPGATIFELSGDHDAALVLGDAFARVTREAVAQVMARAGGAQPPVRPGAPFDDRSTRVAG